MTGPTVGLKALKAARECVLPPQAFEQMVVREGINVGNIPSEHEVAT